MSGRPVYIEIDVEYVRRETILFVANPNHGIGQLGSPAPIARVLRSMNYWMHQGKSLAAGETPRLLSFRLSPEHDSYCERITTHDPDAPCECDDRLRARVANPRELSGAEVSGS